MEISNNINSVILDIDKLTFKKEGVDNFLINLQPSKENVTNTNVLKSSAPLESNDIYLSQLPDSDKSILTKISNIDISFDKIDASLIDLYNNGGGSGGGGGGGGGGTFSGTATSLQFGSSSLSLPPFVGSDGQTLLYNSSTGSFGWGEGGGGSGSNVLTFGTTDKTLPNSLGGHDQVLVYSVLSGQLEWGDRTTGTGGGGVTTTDFSLFNGKVDISFSKVYEDIERIDASINTRIDISLDEIKTSLSNATNDNYYTKTILDGSFTDISTVVHDISGNVQDISATLETFRVAANSNFTTIINELATTTDKFDDNNARFLTVNTNFNAFDDILNDICDNHLKKLIDNSNSLLFGSTYKSLPTTFGSNNQVLISNGTDLTWATQTGTGGGGGTYDDSALINRINNTDASFALADASFVIIDASFALADASFVIVDASFALADASFVIVDASLIDISNTFGVFNNTIVRIDQSLNTFKTDIASNLSTINNHNSTHLNNHSTLSSTVTTLSNNVIQNSTYINDLTTAVNNRYTKLILDNSFTNLSGVVYDLSDVVLYNKNQADSKFATINNTKIPNIDASLTEIKSNITTLEDNFVTLDSSNIVLDASINELNTSVNGVVQSTANINTNITNLNNKKHNYLDTQDNLPIAMPAYRPIGKTLVVSNDETKFEWAAVKEITKESDVNLLNLNVYGSTDVSGNIRVSDEIIVGMTDAREDIRTKGSIKTNTATLHKITFPNNLDHAQRVIDISQQDIYHDVSGIHLTKTYLHDVDISGTVNILPTNSIITPLGVTIKFL